MPGSFTPLDIDTTILHGFHRVRDLDELSSCGVRISEGVALDVPLIVPVTVAFHRGTHLRKGETLISPWLSMSPADQLFEYSLFMNRQQAFRTTLGTMQSSGRLPKSVGARTTDPVEKQEWLWLAQLAGVTQEGPRRGLTTALDMKVRLLKHTSPTATRDSGSYEIEFPDGRPSAYVYWDDNPGRRSITLSLSSEEAEQIAKELARAEQDKLAAK